MTVPARVELIGGDDVEALGLIWVADIAHRAPPP
jgi:hypothetical protein